MSESMVKLADDDDDDAENEDDGGTRDVATKIASWMRFRRSSATKYDVDKPFMMVLDD